MWKHVSKWLFPHENDAISEKKRVQKKNHGFSFEVFKSNVVSTMNHAYKLYSIWDLLARVFFCEIKSKVASKKKIDYKSF